MTKLTDLPAWKKLQQHYLDTKDIHMRELFAQDPERYESFSLKFHDILFDYSKNRITQETMDLLLQLAEQADVTGCRERMFSGYPINNTEHRAVMHTALRNKSGEPTYADGERIDEEISTELDRVKLLAEKIRTRQWLGHSNQPITDVVNIGIGGSHLGPLMVTEALHPYSIHDLHIHYVSNIDENHINNTLETLNPDTTLFIIASKSFTTQDTLVNAMTAKDWLMHKLESEENLHKHLVAVTSNVKMAVEFGVAEENIFKMWDWVGGRYSLWSAIGLSIVISIGAEHFDALLEGAHDVDEHFKTAPLAENIPVIMALIGIWYNNFYNSESIAILPYDQNMHRFPAYLQQADMESNGKGCDRSGADVDYSTGPILFGEIGIASQHAFYQLLHQGTKLVPADMLAPISNFNCIATHHRALMSNIFAQTEALMTGKTEQEVKAELQQQGLPDDEIEALLPFKIFPGNRPTNTFLFYTLNPKTLGSLIALYEHKIFVQGIVWNLNSFDQWGVELGKVLAKNILDEINIADPVSNHDSSTNALINYYLSLKPIKDPN
ncbi:MAG: glucose-6-phosphate isomerase [Gammaproteobacteria bacterium]|nr:glucose-6-phosphate isomerase [Gammaproteobacteria bacterium]